MISFIIPAKNEEGYIAACLASIVAQETSEPFEVIVVDNSSTDNTVKLVQQNYPKVSIINEDKPGTSAARHKGFLEAKGDWLVFLDADVRLPNRNWLKSVRSKICEPGMVALSSHFRYYGISLHERFLQLFGTFIFIYPWIFLLITSLAILPI